MLKEEERKRLINAIIETTLSSNIGSYDKAMGIPISDPAMHGPVFARKRRKKRRVEEL